MTKKINFYSRFLTRVRRRFRHTNYDRYMARRLRNLSEEGRIAQQVFGEYYKEEVEKLQRELDERKQAEKSSKKRVSESKRKRLKF